MKRTVLALGSSLGLVACSSPAVETTDAAYHSITGDGLAVHVAELASDAYEGRAPGTPGEAKTIAYLTAAFADAGAEPALADSYLQPVPLKEVKRTDMGFYLQKDGVETRFQPMADYVSFTGDGRTNASVEQASVVFVGYGIHAPEQGWDDYQGIDVEGAVVLVMRGEPSREGDDSFFMGRDLTPHYHQDSKAEQAARRGAVGMILIHTQASAGWPWTLLQSGGAGAGQAFIDTTATTAKPQISIQLSEPATRKLLEHAGLDYDELTQAANSAPAGGTRRLELTVSSFFTGEERRFSSPNVIARIAGRSRSDECVIYTAHWDHVGTNPIMAEDPIFNGAVDNATGTAALIELAAAYAALPQAPERSVLFMATTAEEKGLLGAEYYADHPLCAPEKTVGVLNMDSHFPFGSFKALTVPGYGFSGLQAYFERASARIGRTVQPDSNPEVGGYYRNDAYPFAKRGIPAIYAVGSPLDEELTEGSEILNKYIDFVTTKYHKPKDEYDPEAWDMTGIEEDVRIFFDAGLELANSSDFPNWRADLSYRALRDDMMARGRASSAASGQN